MAEVFASLQQKGILKKILHAGVGELPNFVDGAKVTFHYRTTKCDDDKTILDDSKALDKPLELYLGKKFKLEIWETLIQTMKVNEIAEFLCTNVKDTAVYPVVMKSLRDINKGHSHHHTNHHCCGMMADAGVGYEDLNELLKTPQPLIFTLELLKFESPNEFEKETWTLNAEEKMAKVPKLREEGNELYKEKMYEEAADKYAEALGILEQLMVQEKPGDPEWIEMDKKKIPFLLNYSQCKLLAGDYYTVITHTTDVLSKDYILDSDRVKALYRRGKAHAAVWDIDEAHQDLTKAAEMDPSLSKTVAKELRLLEERVKEKTHQEKASLRGMFG